MSSSPQGRCAVRPSLLTPDAWIFDFDPAAPGGGGGAAVALDQTVALASVSGVHRNLLLPSRSTGALIVDGLTQTPMPRPAILEAYNVEDATRYNLMSGGDGQGTLLGNMLADAVAALGATVGRWETVSDGQAYHLRVHVVYP